MICRIRSTYLKIEQFYAELFPFFYCLPFTTTAVIIHYHPSEWIFSFCLSLFLLFLSCFNKWKDIVIYVEKPFPFYLGYFFFISLPTVASIAIQMSSEQSTERRDRGNIPIKTITNDNTSQRFHNGRYKSSEAAEQHERKSCIENSTSWIQRISNNFYSNIPRNVFESIERNKFDIRRTFFPKYHSIYSYIWEIKDVVGPNCHLNQTFRCFPFEGNWKQRRKGRPILSALRFSIYCIAYIFLYCRLYWVFVIIFWLTVLRNLKEAEKYYLFICIFIFLRKWRKFQWNA